MRVCDIYIEREGEVPVEIFLQHAQIPKLMQITVLNRIIWIRNCSFGGLLFFQISEMDINLVCEYDEDTVESTIGLNNAHCSCSCMVQKWKSISKLSSLPVH